MQTTADPVSYRLNEGQVSYMGHHKSIAFRPMQKGQSFAETMAISWYRTMICMSINIYKKGCMGLWRHVHNLDSDPLNLAQESPETHAYNFPPCLNTVDISTVDMGG